MCPRKYIEVMAPTGVGVIYAKGPYSLLGKYGPLVTGGGGTDEKGDVDEMGSVEAEVAEDVLSN